MGAHLLVADIHARRRPPSRCTGDYWPDLLGLLWQTVGVAEKHSAVSVAWAGDTFDHKVPVRTDHGVVRELLQVIRAYPCPVELLAGNHDMQHDRIDSVTTTQPLGVLFGKGAASQLNGWATGEPNPYVPVYGVPWLQHWTPETISSALIWYRDQVFERGTGKYRALVVAHAPIYPPGQEPRYEGAEYTPAAWWAEAMGGTGFLYYGHVHEPHFEWEHGGVTFCNYGALSRGSLDEHNLEREVGCTLWDDETGRFTFVPLDARPASEVFLVEQAQDEAAARGRLDAFLESVGQVRLPRLSVEGVIEQFRQQGLDPEVVELAEELLTAAAHEGRKP